MSLKHNDMLRNNISVAAYLEMVAEVRRSFVQTKDCNCPCLGETSLVVCSPSKVPFVHLDFDTWHTKYYH